MTCSRTVLAGIDEGVEQPELHVLDVGLLEVGGLQPAHHAAPLLPGVHQRTVAVELGGQVVGAALFGIVGHVEDGQRGCGAVVGGLVTIGIKLPDIDLAHVVVGQLLKVALDMPRCEAGRTACEYRVDVVPRQQGTLVSAADGLLVVMACKHGGYTAEHPCLGVADIEQVLGILEIVQVRSVVLRAACLARNELCKLAGEGDLRGLGAMQQRQAVEHIREPLRLLLPVHVESPERVVQRFLTHRHLGGEGLFLQVQQRTAEGEVLGEVVLPVHADHRLALHAVVGIRFERHIDVGAGIDDALIQDGDLAGRVVDRIVAALLERDAAGRHHDRSLRHVVGSQRDDVGARTFILSCQYELVLLGILPGHGLRGVIECVEAVFVGHVAHAFRLQVLAQILAEGFGCGEEHAAIVDGVALHEVELSVGVRLHVGIEPVESHDLQQGGGLQLLLGQVGDVGTRGIALVLDVHAELLFLDRGSQIVDVFHHQAPVGLRGIVRRVLQ